MFRLRLSLSLRTDLRDPERDIRGLLVGLEHIAEIADKTETTHLTAIINCAEIFIRCTQM